ncbi:MAG: hypothetical protein GXP30_10805, partial [Verrucomicrobia bacterium]|nr:hypothetical protein [Verrucomicrobiota bacterium]
MKPPSTQLELFPVDDDPDDEAPDQSCEESLIKEKDVLSEVVGGEEAVNTVAELSLDGLDEACLVGHVRKWLEPLYLRGLSERVKVKWNSRLQTTAGRAHYGEDSIELNPLLITISDVAEIERTLKHELAHLVAYERCGKIQRRQLQPHGSEWQEACDDLGISGEARCHELELPGRQMRRQFVYDCPACGDKIERVKRL